jgi:hypothetical protein
VRATTIDALGLAEDLEKAGFARDQALGMARPIRDHSHEMLAWKADLRGIKLCLEARFAQLGQKLEQRIADAQAGLIKRFTGVMIVRAAAIVGLIELLPGPS